MGRTIICLAIIIGSVGCRSTNSEKSYQSWRWDTFRTEAAGHDHVVLVCIYESHFQKMPLPSYPHLDCKGTVVRSYKGTWKTGERIALHFELESAPEGWKPEVGHLTFFLLNKHTADPIGIDTGEDWEYSPEFDRKLQLLYAQGTGR